MPLGWLLLLCWQIDMLAESDWPSQHKTQLRSEPMVARPALSDIETLVCTLHCDLEAKCISSVSLNNVWSVYHRNIIIYGLVIMVI